MVPSRSTNSFHGMKITAYLLQILALVYALGGSLRGQEESDLAAMAAAGDFAQVRELVARLIEREPREPRHRYNLACAEARLGFSELALDALEKAVQLGFKDRALLLTDDDLATLRSLPRFHAAVRLLPAPAPAAPAGPAIARAPTSAPMPPAKAPPAQPALTLPEPARFTSTGPEGLFFMTRFWIFTGSLEQMLWYFDGRGRVFQNPRGVFTPEALARDSARHGTYALAGDKLSVTWSDGKGSESRVERDGKGTGFSWDGGIFSAVAPPDWSTVSGYFEGGTSFSGPSGGGTSVSALTLREDGTFSWSRGASLRSESSVSVATAGSVSGPIEGRWKGEGYQIILYHADGRTERFVAFPTPDARDASKVGMLFFNGSMHLPKPR
jgi:hypothetical protein